MYVIGVAPLAGEDAGTVVAWIALRRGRPGRHMGIHRWTRTRRNAKLMGHDEAWALLDMMQTRSPSLDLRLIPVGG